MDAASELVQALGPVVAELNRLNVRYYVGGSVASSLHGAARSTLDVDLNAELDDSSAMQLVTSLQAEYYVSEVSVRDAVRNRSCFNLLHYASSYKVDIFVSKNSLFDQSVLSRAVESMLGDPVAIAVRIATPEDIILLKLDWFRLGDFASERQWNDLKLVTKLHGQRLDSRYLQHWVNELGLHELWEMLMSEISVGPFMNEC